MKFATQSFAYIAVTAGAAVFSCKNHDFLLLRALQETIDFYRVLSKFWKAAIIFAKAFVPHHDLEIFAPKIFIFINFSTYIPILNYMLSVRPYFFLAIFTLLVS